MNIIDKLKELREAWRKAKSKVEADKQEKSVANWKKLQEVKEIAKGEMFRLGFKCGDHSHAYGDSCERGSFYAIGPDNQLVEVIYNIKGGLTIEKVD